MGPGRVEPGSDPGPTGFSRLSDPGRVYNEVNLTDSRIPVRSDHRDAWSIPGLEPEKIDRVGFIISSTR